MVSTSAKKTFNSGDSLVVTYLATNPPVAGLCKEEQTGFSVFRRLWSNVKELLCCQNISVDLSE
jgi:hypothetical protein